MKTFDTIAESNTRKKHYESTNTSKILHLINPELCVMWDGSIRKELSLRKNGMSYGYDFLPLMQEIIQKSVKECKKENNLSSEEAVNKICSCGVLAEENSRLE